MSLIHNYTGVPVEISFYNDAIDQIGQLSYINVPSQKKHKTTFKIGIGEKVNVAAKKITVKNVFNDIIETTIGPGKIYLAAQRDDGSPIMLDTIAPRLITPLKAYRGKIIGMNVSGFSMPNNKKLVSALDNRICPFGTCRLDDEIWIMLIFILVAAIITLSSIAVAVNVNRGKFNLN
jgi:hypothetical protein